MTHRIAGLLVVLTGLAVAVVLATDVAVLAAPGRVAFKKKKTKKRANNKLAPAAGPALRGADH